MKKLIFLFALIGTVFSSNAQTLVVTTPNSNVQSFSSYGQFYADSVNESVTNQIIVGGYFKDYHQVSLAANKAITDTFTLPASPVMGQTVVIYSNHKFYHKFKTIPKALMTDTLGAQLAIFIWKSPYWQCVQ